MWGGRGLGWSAGRVRAKFLKLLWVRGGFKFYGCGAGADTKFQPAQDSTTYRSTPIICVFLLSHSYFVKIVVARLTEHNDEIALLLIEAPRLGPALGPASVRAGPDNRTFKCAKLLHRKS